MLVAELRNELARFEALRRLLGHQILADLVPVFSGFDPEEHLDHHLVVEVLGRYVAEIRQALDAWWDNYELWGSNCSTTQPVLPQVDMARLEVRHSTCGASEYWLRPVGVTQLGYSNSSWGPTPREVTGLRLGGIRDAEAPELGTAAWHAARALLARTEWSGGGGSLALQLAKSEMERAGIDGGLIELVVEEGFVSGLPDRDEYLGLRLEAENVCRQLADLFNSRPPQELRVAVRQLLNNCPRQDAQALPGWLEKARLKLAESAAAL
jgi:hypothetical protein